MSGLPNWIRAQLDERGWRPADLARHAGLTNATLSRILNGTRQAGPEVCTAIANALGVPPEYVFRLAGLLPTLPPVVEQEKEALGLFRALDTQMRSVALRILRTLGRETAPETPRRSQIQEPDPASRHIRQPRTVSERLAWDLARDIQSLPPEDQQRVFDLMRRLRGVERTRGVPAESDSN